MPAALGPLHRRYLRLLGLSPGPPDIAFLRGLVAAHLERVPFENVSKLLLYAREGAGRAVSLEEFLDGIEQLDLGGTCYSSNPFFAGLLQALGFEAALLGADMARPDVHTSIRVQLNGAGYHVDVGYGAPFRAPMPLHRLPVEIESGAERYQLRAHERPGAHELRMFVGGELRHGYVVHPPPRSPSFFADTVRASFAPGSAFMTRLRISRQFAGGALDLRNRRIIDARGGRSCERQVADLPELRRAVNEHFLMPRCPVEAAVAVLERLAGRPFFGEAAWDEAD